MFIAWEEWNATTLNGRIMISKYDANGNWLAGPTQVDNNNIPATERHEVALAVGNSCSVTVRTCLRNSDCPTGETCAASWVVAAWWERKSDGTQPEAIFRRRLSAGLGTWNGENESKVNTPPALPAGAQRAARVGVATDAATNFVITWQANVNDAVDITWNVFGKGFDLSGNALKNDFLVDLAPRTSAARYPRLARSSVVGKFAYVWRDNRSGHYDVYTRAVPSLQ